jgi:peroxiredoxin
MIEASKIIRIIVMVIFLTVFPDIMACSGHDNQSLGIGYSAPAFKLNDLDNKSTALSSYSGKAVFITFWTTSCPPCLAELPYIQELNLDWSNRDDVVILTVNMGEDGGTVRNFMQTNNYSFPVLLDSQFAVSELYLIQYTPTSILIEKDGSVHSRIIGAFRDKTTMVKSIEGLLKP